MRAGDMRPAQMFADDGTVLGLHQSVVAGMPRPRLVCSMSSLFNNPETCLAGYLKVMASRIEGKPAEVGDNFSNTLQHLK